MTYTSYQTMENQSNPSILLVEDDPALALIIKDTLEGEGFQVTHTADGLHGLDGFVRCRPDLVVADIMMPGMDGFEMVRRMRRVDTTTPILFLTARSSLNDLVKGFGLGANDYLKKPFKMLELIVRIRALLGRPTPTERVLPTDSPPFRPLHLPDRRATSDRRRRSDPGTVVHGKRAVT